MLYLIKCCQMLSVFIIVAIHACAFHTMKILAKSTFKLILVCCQILSVAVALLALALQLTKMKTIKQQFNLNVCYFRCCQSLLLSDCLSMYSNPHLNFYLNTVRCCQWLELSGFFQMTKLLNISTF